MSMTVKELRESLEGVPDDASVILSSDAEGNEFRWAASADFDGVLVHDYGWYADIYSSNWSSVEADMDEDEWAERLTKPRIFVITPMN